MLTLSQALNQLAQLKESGNVTTEALMALARRRPESSGFHTVASLATASRACLNLSLDMTRLLRSRRSKINTKLLAEDLTQAPSALPLFKVNFFQLAHATTTVSSRP